MDRLDVTDATWTRVSPKYIWPELIGYLVSGLVFAAVTAFLWFFGQWWGYAITAVVVVVTIVVAAFTPRRVRAIGYQLRDDDLLLRKGIMFVRFVAVPYGRMQLIDINRGPVVRALGLSDLKFVTAAAASAVTIPGVPAEDAERLRDRLVELAESRRAGL
ncbi:PH domain-containing protein [Frigoribacterium sp. 2-23]|uniref:PH domain-containing protein n=1 Tax=Frigoribacterium sp. 2-23 TaxID=3415006 RepID=UPI003C6EF30B